MNILNTSTHSQRTRILEASKRQGGITSMEARSLLSIIDPPKRMSELGAQGHKFAIRYEDQYDTEGRKHPRCARYVWISSPEQEAIQ